MVFLLAILSPGIFFGVLNCLDGAAVPVVEHPEEKMYVPELIFGHLLTSSNFDDSTQVRPLSHICDYYKHRLIMQLSRCLLVYLRLSEV